MKENKIPSKTISPIIPVELIERIRAYTARTGVKQNHVVTQAVKEYLDRMEEKEAEKK